MLDLLARERQLFLPVKVWPHHFDLATRLRGPEGAYHMGAAWSPGYHTNSTAPYFHITRFPHKHLSREGLPALEGLEWNRHSWFGLFLHFRTLLAEPTGRGQVALVTRLYTEGLAAVEGWTVEVG